jgi:HEAT repeat protein
MPNFRRFLSHRSLAFVGGAALLFGLAMLHPYPRQSLFGPQIEGIPWCVWEEEIRVHAHPRDERGWWFRLREKLGLQPGRAAGPDVNARVALPVYLHLADDSDVEVRRFALEQLGRWTKENETEILPIFRGQLQDADPHCRLAAAHGLWHATKDRDVTAIVLSLKDVADVDLRCRAILLLGLMAAGDPNLFDPLALMCADAEARVRHSAVYSMRHFGKRGVPILRKAFHDSSMAVRMGAINAALNLREEGTGLYPDLQRLKDDPDPVVSSMAGDTLYRMDPKQFPKPASWVD